MTSHLWYVAYGSNLLRERLRCYVEGGRALGARRHNPGARDRARVTAGGRVALPHPLLFGGPSPTWHGGPAFLDVSRSGRSVGRAWRLSHGQFEDLVAQENARPPGTVDVSWDVVRHGGTVVDDRYGRVVALDPVDGLPAVTLTYVRAPTPRAPDPAYVSLIRRGLHELGLTAEEADAALRAQPQLA